MHAIDRHAWTNCWRRHRPGERLLLAGELRVLTPERPLSRRRLAGIGGLLLAVALGFVLVDRGLA